MIIEETGINLIFDEAARIARDRRRVLFFEAIIIIIPLLKHPGHPAALVFDRDNLEFGMPFENSVKDDLEQSVGNVHQLEIDAAAIALNALSIFVFVVAVTRQDMETDRGVEFLAC